MKTLTTPISRGDIAGLKTGDVVFFSGLLATGRDEVHRRVARGEPSPFDFRGTAVFHAGPIVRESHGPRYDLVSVGPTSSIRMEEWAADFIEKTGVALMIGKGGMGDKTAAACRERGAIHCVFPGGCAVLGAGRVEGIEAVHWKELGMAECVWEMRVRDFGPLVVSVDAEGNNLFAQNAALYASRVEAGMRAAIGGLRNRGG